MKHIFSPPRTHRHHILSKISPCRSRSRAELARETGLSSATVSRITRELVRGKILTEVSPRRSAAGRPAQALEINGKRGFVLGISPLIPTARLLVMNLRGDILKEVQAPLESRHGPRGILDSLKRTIQSALRNLPPGASRLSGVGLALPGQWDAKEGTSLSYPRMPEWKKIPIRRYLEEWTGSAATLIGYAPALAVAEQARRAGTEPRNLICVEVADHVAMGVIVNGEVLEGASGNPGELGHITVDPAGPLCYCGNMGCLEAVASCTAVVDELRRSEAARDLPRDASFEDILRLAREDNPFCARLLGRAARTLGIGLATALNLFNPEVLVLNGRFFEAGAWVLAPLRVSLQERALPNTLKPLTLDRSTLGPSAPALGAGIEAIKQALQKL